MKAVIFDLDDTLYDQIQPFKQAIQSRFSFSDDQIRNLYQAFRFYGDQVFEAAATGEMLLSTSHIYRMQMALKTLNVTISDKEALKLQERYQTYQHQLILEQDVVDLLDYCSRKGLQIGIITNGPSSHQRAKIESLQLHRWIKPECLLISEEVAWMKPDIEIFQEMQKRMKLSAKDMIFIGDSFEKDIVGAKKAGYQTIWLQRYSEGLSNHEGIRADAVIQHLAEVRELLDGLTSFKSML